MHIHTQNLTRFQSTVRPQATPAPQQEAEAEALPTESVTLSSQKASPAAAVGLMVGGIIVGAAVGSQNPVLGVGIMLGSVFGSLAMARG